MDWDGLGVKALLGRYFTVGHLMQIPAVFLFGLFIDGWMWATSYLVTDVYWQQMLMSWWAPWFWAWA